VGIAPPVAERRGIGTPLPVRTTAVTSASSAETASATETSAASAHTGTAGSRSASTGQDLRDSARYADAGPTHVVRNDTGSAESPIVLLRQAGGGARTALHDERIRSALIQVGDFPLFESPYIVDGARVRGLPDVQLLKSAWPLGRRTGAGGRLAGRGLRGSEALHQRRFGERRQLKFGRRSIVRHADFACEFREAQHLHLQGPRAIEQVGEGKYAAFIGGGGHLLIALCRGDGSARNGQLTGLHGAVIFRCHHAARCDADDQQAH
jgi:hypothetical protein